MHRLIIFLSIFFILTYSISHFYPDSSTSAATGNVTLLRNEEYFLKLIDYIDRARIEIVVCEFSSQSGLKYNNVVDSP